MLTIGTPEDLDAATLDDVKAFFRTWYVPNNATLVIAGDIDRRRAALAEKYFGPHPGRDVPRPREVERPARGHARRGEKPRRRAGGGAAAGVRHVAHAAECFNREDAQLDLVAHVLAGGKTSRLYKRLVYDIQIAQDVQRAPRRRGSSARSSRSSPRRSRTTRAKSCRNAHRRGARRSSSTGGVHAEELARADGERLDLIFDLERDASRANTINMYNQLAGDPGFLPKDMERYAAATVASVVGAAKDFRRIRRIVAVVTPDKSAPVSGVLRRVQPAPVVPRVAPGGGGN